MCEPFVMFFGVLEVDNPFVDVSAECSCQYYLMFPVGFTLKWTGGLSRLQSETVLSVGCHLIPGNSYMK